MEHRDLQHADLQQLVELVNRNLAYDTLDLRDVQEKIFDDPEADGLRMGIWSGSDLTAAMTGTVRQLPDGPVAYLQLFVTEVRFGSQGLATSLHAELLRRVSTRGATKISVVRGVPYYLAPGLDPRYTAALCWLRKLGYVKRGDGVNLRVDLRGKRFNTSEPERRLAIEGFSFHRAELEIQNELAAYLSEQWAPPWRVETLRALTRRPSGCHIARRDGEIVGFAVRDSTRYQWFGPMGTNSELRGKGIGTILYHRCLADWQHLGVTEIDVAWAGPIRYYARCSDAVVHRVFWEMERDLSPNDFA